MRLPARMGSASICTTLHCPGSGRYLVYGKFVPTMNRVSQSSIASIGRRGPEEADAAEAERVVIGYDGLPRQRLDDRAAQTFGRSQDLVSGAQALRPRPA